MVFVEKWTTCVVYVRPSFCFFVDVGYSAHTKRKQQLPKEERNMRTNREKKNVYTLFVFFIDDLFFFGKNTHETNKPSSIVSSS